MRLMSPLRFLVVLAAVLAAALPFALSLTGCAHSTRAGAPKLGEEPLPDDPEAALAVVQQAEAELMAALGPQPGGAVMTLAEPKGGDAREAEAPLSPSPPPEPAEAAPADADESRAVLQKGEAGQPAADPCARACRALASMRRATDHLCGLAGEADARCASARERVQGAGARVHASCPRCAG